MDSTMTTRRVQRKLTGVAVKETRCHCGKLGKNIKGLKIHQARAKCFLQMECTVNTSHILEDQGQEEAHSTENLLPSQRNKDKTLNIKRKSNEHKQVTRFYLQASKVTPSKRFTP